MPTTPRTEESIFAEAIDQPSPEEQAAFLDAACGNDAPLRARVDKLLKSHTGAGSFLRKPPAATTDQPLIERPGTIIGQYKLLQQIGEGGMGVVYMAEQEQPVRRRVALKIIKPGMDSRQVIARFEAERQALAMMDHQNIARVLDAGTTESGRPYFVMELVHGVPLTKFCDDNRLTLSQRLELFVPVCHAIQHAHHKGIIHRDIKPSNILVTMYDDKPVPKVIDFGVAKAVEQRLTERTLFTQYGMLVGTFEYMSPEQAEMNAFGVDTRSDVYSLGVLLYELLTGTTPLERPRLREAALNELVRLIKEEEPPRPSARLSGSGALPKVAAACQTDPARLSQLLRGELDWIVMKCLEKDRTRRYETANGLARDVERYLHDEPVEACPPSVAYRLKKIGRKHRVLLTTAASFVALLMAGVVVSTLLAAWAVDAQRNTAAAQAKAEMALAREQMARQEAVTAKEKAESISKRLNTAIQIANEGTDYYYRRNFASAHERFTKAAEVEPGLDTVYIHRAALYTYLGLWDRAAEDYERRFEVSSRASAQTCYEYALLKLYSGDEEAYRRACQEAIRQHGKSAYLNDQYYVLRACLLSPEPASDPDDLVRRGERLVTNSYVPWYVAAAGQAHLRAGNYEKAAARLGEAIDRGAKSPGGVHAVNYVPLSIALYQLGQKPEAEQALAKAEEAIDGWTKSMSDGLLGAMPMSWWDWVECQVYYREAKTMISGARPAIDPRLTARFERALGAITHGDAHTFMEAGREQVKHKAWQQAAVSFSKVMEQLPYGFRYSSTEMGMCVEMVQQPEVFARLVELRPSDPRLWEARGQIYANQGEWAKAGDDYAKALDLRTQEWIQAGRSRARGDWAAAGRGRTGAAFELAALRLLEGDEGGYRDLCATIMTEHDQVDDQVSASFLSRACTLSPNSTSDWSAAVRLAELAVTKEPRTAWFLFALGAAQYRSGRYVEAVKRLEESLVAHPAWVGRCQNHVMLAMACHQLGRQDEAREWLAKAKAGLEEMDQARGKSRFGYATSDYMSDWLTIRVLLPEAEKCLSGSEKQ